MIRERAHTPPRVKDSDQGSDEARQAASARQSPGRPRYGFNIFLAIGFPLLVLAGGQLALPLFRGGGATLSSLSHGFAPFADLSWRKSAMIVVLNVLVLHALWVPVLLAIRRARVAMPLFAGLYVMVLAANEMKIAHTGQPIYPWDVWSIGHAPSLLAAYAIPSSLSLLGLFIASLVFVFGVRWPDGRIDRRQIPLLLGSAACASAAVCWLAPMLGENRFIGTDNDARDRIVNTAWAPGASYAINLFPLAFAMNAPFSVINAPSGYPEDLYRLGVVDSTADAREAIAPLRTSRNIRPDVVIVLSESFFDLNRLETIRFSRSPAPAFDALFDKTGRSLVTPAFGGGTANVEFELLTGLRTAMLPQGSVPYQHYIARPIPVSLGFEFKNAGYRTTAIHPYDGSFWNRRSVYPLLGIDRFVDRDGFADPAYRGPYISDANFADRLIAQLEQFPREDQLILGVSMENHGGYRQADRYPNHTVVPITRLGPDADTVLANYAEGMSDADASLRRLAEHVMHRRKPTLLVFFGDHLSLPLDILHASGYISSRDYWSLPPDELRKLHTVQSVMIANYPLPMERPAAQSISQLGADILRAAGIPLSRYWQFVEKTGLIAPAHVHGLFIGPDGAVLAAPGGDQSSYKKAMDLVTYDLLFGKQVIAGEGGWGKPRTVSYRPYRNAVTAGPSARRE